MHLESRTDTLMIMRALISVTGICACRRAPRDAVRHMYGHAYRHVHVLYGHVCRCVHGNCFWTCASEMCRHGRDTWVSDRQACCDWPMAYIRMAYIVMGNTGMASTVVAYVIMSRIVMAYIAMAYIVMDYPRGTPGDKFEFQTTEPCVRSMIQLPACGAE